jgi:hypothetical protein
MQKATCSIAISAMWMAGVLVGQSIGSTPLTDNGDGTVNVIVQYREGTDEFSRVSSIRRAVRHNHDLRLLRSHALTVKASDVAALRADPAVESITPDYPVQATATNIVPDYGWATVMNLTSALPPFQLSLDGGRIGVAVIDSGIAEVDDLEDTNDNKHVVFKQSFVPGRLGHLR